MAAPQRILIQTTIPPIADDWHVGRFSLLAQYLRGLRGEDGAALFEVMARDRASANDGPDPVLSNMDESDFDQLWLFAVDEGDGLSAEECAAIGRFRAEGGGLMVTRDQVGDGRRLVERRQVIRAMHPIEVRQIGQLRRQKVGRRPIGVQSGRELEALRQTSDLVRALEERRLQEQLALIFKAAL